jgi:type IVB pilus formation R64 PilN family outer membrane protein
MNNPAFTIRRALAAATLTGVALLTGCATQQAAQTQHTAISAHVARDMRALRHAAAPRPLIVTRHAAPYLLGQSIALRQAQPAVLRQHVVFQSAASLNLMQAASQLSQIVGIPVHVAPEVKSAVMTEQSGQAASASIAPASARSATAIPGLPGFGALTLPALPNAASRQGMLKISWDGSLSGLLDMMAAQSGCYWAYTPADGVRFYLTETRVFSVAAIPGKSTVSTSVSNAGSTAQSSGGGGSSSGSSSSGSAGTTSQAASMTTSVDIYKRIKGDLAAIINQVSSSGSAGLATTVHASYSVDPAAGQIVVTGTPAEVAAVAAYVKQLNAQLEQNVLIDVHVYAVSTDHANDVALNIQGALSSLLNSTAAKFTLGSSAAAIPNSTQAGMSLVSGNFSAQTVAQALATVGNVSLVTSGSVLALNGQPTPMQVAQQRSYVASSSVTTTANVGSSATITPGQYTTGFSGNFLPLVRGNDVMLQYSIDLTQDLGLQTFASSGTTIELPNLATQAFQQRVVVRSGQTIVISGFEQSGSTDNRQGVGNPNFFGLGGGRSASTSRTALVIVMHVLKVHA